MANIKIEIPIRFFDEKKAVAAKSFFSDITIPWTFCKKETLFTSSVCINKKLQNTYNHEIARTKELIKLFPGDEILKAELQRYEERAKNDWVYDFAAVFNGDIAAEIDVSENSILHYNSPVCKDIKGTDIPRLKQHIVSDMLDDFYEENFKKILIAIIMISLLVNPSIEPGLGICSLFIDGQKYKSERLINSLDHAEVFKNYQNIITTNLTFNQAVTWIKKYTNLHENKVRSPVAFSALTYVLNREPHESLLYSVIGLESIYSPDNHGISNTLQKHINHIFPSITKEQIKSIYRKRSDFVHGKEKINLYKDNSDIMNGIFPYDDVAFLATALLFETIRKLIANDATKIIFHEQISYQFR